MKKIKFWIVNELSTTSAEILMYGYIGEYEAIDDAAFLMELRNLESKYSSITIRVNCGGGDVFKGMTIFNAISQCKSNIQIKIDGIAASMGAVFPLAAKKGNVSASKYARVMTHRVRGVAIGNADEMRAAADECEVWEGTIADVIAGRTGLSKEDAKKKYIVNKDRWISAAQALDEGLIDSIYDADPIDVPENSNESNAFSAYNKILLNSFKNPNDMKAIALLLGLTENATETEITAAIDKLKKERDTAVNAQAASLKEKVKKLADKAISAKLYTEAERPELESMAMTNYDSIEKMINKMQPVKKPTELLNRSQETTEQNNDDVKDWEGLVAKGQTFVAKFKEENSQRYQEMLDAYVAKGDKK